MHTLIDTHVCAFVYYEKSKKILFENINTVKWTNVASSFVIMSSMTFVETLAARKGQEAAVYTKFGMKSTMSKSVLNEETKAMEVKKEKKFKKKGTYLHGIVQNVGNDYVELLSENRIFVIPLHRIHYLKWKKKKQ